MFIVVLSACDLGLAPFYFIYFFLVTMCSFSSGKCSLKILSYISTLICDFFESNNKSFIFSLGTSRINTTRGLCN